MAKKDFATTLIQLVIAGQKARSAVLMSNDPAIHAACQSAWTIGSSPAVTNCKGRLSAAKPTRLDRREGVGIALRAFAHPTLAAT